MCIGKGRRRFISVLIASGTGIRAIESGRCNAIGNWVSWRPIYYFYSIFERVPGEIRMFRGELGGFRD